MSATRRKGGRWCSAPNCRNNSNTSTGISYFSFPKDKERAKKWTVSCRRKDLLNKDSQYLNKNCAICSVHFEDMMFLNFLRNRLKPHAVPTLFDIPNLPKPITNKRKEPKERISVQTCPVAKRIKIDVQNEVMEEITNTSSPEVAHSTRTTPNPEVVEEIANMPRSEVVECSKTFGTMVNFSDHNTRDEELRRKLKTLHDRNRYLESKVSALCLRENATQIGIDQFKNFCDKFLNKDLAQLVKMQIDLIGRSKKGMRYTLEYKTMALTLYFISPNAYMFMQKLLQLPTIRSLRLMTQNWQYSPGPNQFIFCSLQLKSSDMCDIDKYCALSIDEMSLKCFLFYCISNDEVVGLHDTGIKQLKPATSVLVFMLRSLSGNWKQPITYYFTNSTCSAAELKQMLVDVLERLNDIGLKVCLLVSDMGSNFLKFARNEGITPESPYIVIGNQKIFYMFDVPHLMKSLRNNLLKHHLYFGDKVVSWQHIVKFYHKDKLQNLRLAKKLTDAHLFPNGFQKMKVKLAVQIFSHTVASSLFTYVSLGALDAAAVGTAEFLEICNDVFDLLNSSSKICDKFYGRAWIGSEKQHELLNKFMNLIESVVIQNKEKKDVTATIKCLEGFKVTISAFLQLWSYLQTASFTYVFTRRLTQDCLENFFGSVRQQGGNSYSPTPVQFTRAFKKLVCLNYFKHSEGSNCAEDFDVLLSKCFNDSGRLALSVIKNTAPKHIAVNCVDYRDNLPGSNALQYICGYLVNKCLTIHECHTCLEYSQETANTFDSTKVYSHFKAYENKDMTLFGNLKCVSLAFVGYIEQLENIFVDNFVKCMGKNVGNELIKLMQNVELSHPCKDFPHNYLVRLFVRMRIFYALKFINRNFKGKSKTEKDHKLIKVVHL